MSGTLSRRAAVVAFAAAGLLGPAAASAVASVAAPATTQLFTATGLTSGQAANRALRAGEAAGYTAAECDLISNVPNPAGSPWTATDRCTN